MAKILIVDDQAVNRRVLGRLLGRRGYHILEAGDGAEALTVTRAERPELLISDLLMPTMDGFELIRRLRAEPDTSRTRVILYTAQYHHRQARTLAETCGVRHVLAKPFEPDAVLRAVAEELELPSPAAPRLPTEEAFTRDHRDLLHGTLVRKVGDLEAANQRLSALISLGQQLALQYDADLLLDLYCHAAREVLAARYAVVGIRDDGGPGLRHLFTSGMRPNTLHVTRASLAAVGADLAALTDRKPRRLVGLNGDPTAAGLPATHPAIDSYLGVAIATPARAYGWLYLADKIGAAGFGDDDERVAVMLAAQLAVAYENTQRYEQLQRRAAELEEAVKELEAFSHAVSHDLRAPLRAVLGFAEALEEGCGDRLDERGRHHLGLIQSGARDLNRLIDDLLAFTRVGRRPMAATDLDMAALAREVFGERTDTGRAIAFQVGDVPPAHGDRALVRQVFTNLLDNAIKFTSDKSDAAIEVGGYEADAENVYYVRDNGIGFDPRYAGRLFEPFQRLHRSTEFDGAGIGLSLVRRAVHRHGGRVWAEGEEGGGATFSFTLPRGGNRP